MTRPAGYFAVVLTLTIWGGCAVIVHHLLYMYLVLRSNFDADSYIWLYVAAIIATGGLMWACWLANRFATTLHGDEPAIDHLVTCLLKWAPGPVLATAVVILAALMG